MDIEIRMPQLGLTMEEGEVSKWHVKPGDYVKIGDPLAEITTDKLTNELVSDYDGFIVQLLAKEGEDIPVKGLLAMMSDEMKEVSTEFRKEPIKKEVEPELGPDYAASRDERKHVVVIGAGPGGYVAAIRAAQLGAQVTIIEKERIGGTCLNVGCVPTKSILHSGEIYQLMTNEAVGHGVLADNIRFDWSAVQSRKQGVVDQLVAGVEGLLLNLGVNVIYGEAQVGKDHNVIVGDSVISYDKLIIAAGSVPAMPPIKGIENNVRCVDSTKALSLKELPKKLIIIGGGVIGIEFAAAFNNFGCEVTVLEAMSKILPLMDEEITALLQKRLDKDGIGIHTSTFVKEVQDADGRARVIVEMNGEEQSLDADLVLIAVGRRTATESLGLDESGIQHDKGRIEVNDSMQTNKPDIYAIGDCLGKTMLAHVASAQGETAAEHAMGSNVVYNSKLIPSCVYTHPEVAGVGLTQAELDERGIDYRKGTFSLAGNAKAIIEANGRGFVKVLASSEYGEILGVHMFGPRATDLIAEATTWIQSEMTIDEVIETIHAHPTVAESLREAVMAIENRAIHK